MIFELYFPSVEIYNFWLCMTTEYEEMPCFNWNEV